MAVAALALRTQAAGTGTLWRLRGDRRRQSVDPAGSARVGWRPLPAEDPGCGAWEAVFRAHEV